MLLPNREDAPAEVCQWRGDGELVGVDPGGTTGLVRLTSQGCQTGEVRGLGDLRRWVSGAAVVVMEDFLGSGGRGVNYRDPLIVIGAVSLICLEEGVPLVLQSPSSPTRRDKELAARLVRGRHARSAMAHLICWGRRDGRISLL